MIWADRVAAALLVLFGLAFVFMFQHGDMTPEARFFDVLLAAAWKFVLPVWIALRAIDWITGGPARRQGGR